METKTIRFENDFHNTSTTVRAKRIGLSSGRESWAINVRVMDRVAWELCGIGDCTCDGLRGPQEDPYAEEAWNAYHAWQSTRGRVGESGRIVVRG